MKFDSVPPSGGPREPQMNTNVLPPHGFYPETVAPQTLLSTSLHMPADLIHRKREAKTHIHFDLQVPSLPLPDPNLTGLSSSNS